MSTISWVTPKGTLGVIPENTFYSYILEAEDSSQQTITYNYLSGQLPGSIYITRSGVLQGIPSILEPVDQVKTFTFTVRAINNTGNIADRTFSLTVSNLFGPQILPRPDFVGAWFDGNFLDYTFTAVNDNAAATTTWSVIEGTLPPGTTLTASGRLSGYVDIIAANYSQLGYEAVPNDSIEYDNLAKSTDRFYNFTIQAFDGSKYDTLNVRVLIVSKGNYTADNLITSINNTFIRIDADNKYRPIILNAPDSLPVQISGTTFAYKFLAYDPEEQDVSWTIDEFETIRFDNEDFTNSQLQLELGTLGAGPYLLDQVPPSAARLVVKINDVLQTAFVDYVVSGVGLNELIFLTSVPVATDIIEITFINVGYGFDSALFDQGASGLPSGLNINTDTGWVFGTLPTQVEDLTTYSFRVTAYRTLTPAFRSDSVSFNLTVKRTLNEEIIWNSHSDLGIIDNGSISELSVNATHTLGKELEYSIIYEPYRKVPQGLKLLRSGDFTGKTSFRYFNLDGAVGWIDVTSTAELEVGMSVQGPGVASGCRITAIIDSNTLEVSPAVYVEQGSVLTFSNQQVTRVVSTISNAITTSIDGGATTFDQVCRFTVQARSIDRTISSNKSFQVRVRPYNLAPYENVYLRALPPESQRDVYKTIVSNNYLFPESLIYRSTDPYFGVQKNMKMLFVAGLTPTSAANFVNTIANNHYTKTINFGEIKTARATDSSGRIVYEVVYIDAVDTQVYNTVGPALSIQPQITNPYLYDGLEYTTIYPNSFKNMQSRLSAGIGYTNQGALPLWMTSVQEDGMVLGLTRAIVLAYTKPGASKLIQYRVKNSVNLLDGDYSFIVDRYQWDNYLSQFWDLDTNTFLPSIETTFDKFPNLTRTIDVLDFTLGSTITNSNAFVVSNDLRVGQGWQLISRDKELTLTANTVVTNVSGNVLTISSNISAVAGTQFRLNGVTAADYAVSQPFNSINGSLVKYVRALLLIDGVTNFVKNETIVFAKQTGFFGNPTSDGWIDSNGSLIPGYLEKVSLSSTVDQRGGRWQITWNDLPTLGFDSDLAGFDQESPNILHSYFDQGNDSEIRLIFVNEVLLNQTVKIRAGKTYPSSTLQYRIPLGEALPRYLSYQGVFASASTTFDGGSCTCRESDLASGRQGIRGGTAFSSNRDKYIIPESLDKYIKFPKDGVFV